jgi:hypothetical protein
VGVGAQDAHLTGAPREKAMRDSFSRDDLQELLESREGPCITLYLPTHRHGPETLGDAATLRRMLRELAESLAEGPAALRERVERLSRFAWRLLGEDAYWQHLDLGLALFLAPEFERAYRLPVRFRERWAIGPRFVIAPLLGALAGPSRFLVLALSVGEVRLLEVSREGVRRLRPAGLPADMDSALGLVQFYSGLQAHTAAPAGPGRRPLIFHGHGDADEERFERDLESYFRLVAQTLRAAVTADAPLVVAAVEPYLPILRRAAGNALPVAALIPGNAESRSDAELAEEGRRLLAGTAGDRYRRELERLRELGDRGRIEVEASGVVAAAFEGRVDTLFFDAERSLWGGFDEGSRGIDLHADRLPGDVDLVDATVSRTLAQRGSALAVPSAEMPAGGPLAAILRY